MSDVVQFKQRVTTDQYFGGCPHCGGNDGYMNVGSEHWFRCDEHRTNWKAGSNLFSGWRNEDETIWRENEYRLAEYQTVEPIYPPQQSA